MSARVRKHANLLCIKPSPSSPMSPQYKRFVGKIIVAYSHWHKGTICRRPATGGKGSCAAQEHSGRRAGALGVQGDACGQAANAMEYTRGKSRARGRTSRLA